MTETRDQSIRLRRRILDDEKRRRELEKLAAIAFPKEAADAMRHMGRILGEGRDSERRRRLMDSIEGFIKRGEWPLLELADIPLLWYPNDPEKQSALLAKMKAAFEAGELLPMVAQGFTATHLCNWKDAPPIPINSPMIHFLPAWMEREGQREPQAPESAARVGTASIKRLKKAALISKHEHHWPTVENDFRHSDENGLAKVAGLPEHGFWNEIAALQWAEEEGKLTDSSKPEANPLDAAWRGVKRK